MSGALREEREDKNSTLVQADTSDPFGKKSFNLHLTIGQIGYSHGFYEHTNPGLVFNFSAMRDDLLAKVVLYQVGTVIKMPLRQQACFPVHEWQAPAAYKEKQDTNLLPVAEISF
jgi:hypothetical protein